MHSNVTVGKCLHWLFGPFYMVGKTNSRFLFQSDWSLFRHLTGTGYLIFNDLIVWKNNTSIFSGIGFFQCFPKCWVQWHHFWASWEAAWCSVFTFAWRKESRCFSAVIVYGSPTLTEWLNTPRIQSKKSEPCHTKIGPLFVSPPSLQQPYFIIRTCMINGQLILLLTKQGDNALESVCPSVFSVWMTRNFVNIRSCSQLTTCLEECSVTHDVDKDFRPF